MEVFFKKNTSIKNPIYAALCCLVFICACSVGEIESHVKYVAKLEKDPGTLSGSIVPYIGPEPEVYEEPSSESVSKSCVPLGKNATSKKVRKPERVEKISEGNRVLAEFQGEIYPFNLFYDGNYAERIIKIVVGKINFGTHFRARGNEFFVQDGSIVFKSSKREFKILNPLFLYEIVNGMAIVDGDKKRCEQLKKLIDDNKDLLSQRSGLQYTDNEKKHKSHPNSTIVTRGEYRWSMAILSSARGDVCRLNPLNGGKYHFAPIKCLDFCIDQNKLFLRINNSSILNGSLFEILDPKKFQTLITKSGGDGVSAVLEKLHGLISDLEKQSEPRAIVGGETLVEAQDMFPNVAQHALGEKRDEEAFENFLNF